MPWNSQGGGGPWGNGGGNNGGQNPWGKRPSGGNGGGGTPPDLDEMIRKGQDRLKRLFPGGGGGAKGIILIGLAIVGIWLLTGFYRVQPGEQGVTLLFGKWVGTTGPGLNYFLPAPIGEVITPNVERTNQIEVGYRGSGMGANSTRDVPEESLMLTGDQNIIDIDYVVQWRIRDAGAYLFNIRDPETTIKLASESAIREVVGKTDLEAALTIGRVEVEDQTRTLLQSILDGYKSGIFISEVKMQKVDPPKEVIDSFNDVQRARQDRDRSRNEALAYRNDIIPRAKGNAERMIMEARAYKDQVVKDAQGEAARFDSVYNSYLTAKDVTKRRLYLETMQEVLKSSTKVILNQKDGSNGVVPYLPLPEIQKNTASQNTGGDK
ncbi:MULTISPECIES: FtsH protease activity modulator HflK [unclassified Thalassospira]|jgi:membrane protease subunit HflK|uniref:FtsH protease activity modulator HflK n=1 Tax=unclassified Thalassospira TaxID=2648997 RepID=UPI000A1ECCBB|nr:FtsH protease activity modulator HflK [Thalassospira sp. MCCC 1A01428]OSQ42599.1 membrane protein [Thalassospira sp. MCCC 1A01428]